MKQGKHHLIIPFSGLKKGMHQFSFDIDATFFEQFENTIIESAEVHIDIEFLKKENMLQVDFVFSGIADGFCDRCTDPIEITINGEAQLIVKFGEEEFEETDEVKIIPHGEFELDISKEVYDYVHLLLPNKIAHEEKRLCNKEVIEKLDELSVEKQNIDTEQTDPRWAALLNLKDKN